MSGMDPSHEDVSPEYRKEHWSLYGDSAVITRGEFYARMDILNSQVKDLDHRVDHVEGIAHAPKDFVMDIIGTVWGKLLILILIGIAGYVVSQVGFDIHKIGLGGLFG